MSQLLRSVTENKKWYIAIYLLVTFHIAGIAGILNESTRDLFLSLTPVTLILSGLTVAWFHKTWNNKFAFFLAACYFIGLSVEILGVNTGFPFGKYAYGSSLGIQVLGTPLLIGFNWALLIYCTGIVAEATRAPLYYKIPIASTLMVIIDMLMEPVAPFMKLWVFETGIAPVRNYIAWFAVSLFLHFIFYRLAFTKSNPVAIIYFIVVSLFFASLCLMIT